MVDTVRSIQLEEDQRGIPMYTHTIVGSFFAFFSFFGFFREVCP